MVASYAPFAARSQQPAAYLTSASLSAVPRLSMSTYHLKTKTKKRNRRKAVGEQLIRTLRSR